LKPHTATFIFFILILGCNEPANQNKTDTSSLHFLGEYILPSGTNFEGTIVGGLSSIDYSDGIYYLICDDSKIPRFYSMKMQLDKNGIKDVKVIDSFLLNSNNDKKKAGKADPEGLRFLQSSNTLFMVDEGDVQNGHSPKLYEMNEKGSLLREFKLPESFHASTKKKKWGPRHNKSLESISLSKDGKTVLIAMESTLKQDGKKPKKKPGNYPVRLAEIETKSGSIKNQFAYHLDSVARPSKEVDGVQLNGLSEILVYDENSILAIERSFSSGYDDGRDKLTNGVVDNIEGVSFGPNLANGNKTLIFVADDNFGKYGSQMNQFIALEIR